MAGSGKVLSVSYRGFTCGLDGFDDPLQTMTAILDYLGYLEAISGDTGLAPDAPDPEILTGIAQRGTDSRVEILRQDDGFLLRAVPAQARAGAAPAKARARDADTVRTEADPAGGAASATAARVLRVRRTELERLMTPEAPDGGADIPPETAPAPLSPEAERALQRELAAITAEPPPEDATDLDSAPAERQTPTGARDDLLRIFAATDGHLDTAESSRRRNAIQHLRAALAATRAETRGVALPRRERDGAAGRGAWPAAARLRRAPASAHRLRDVIPAGSPPAPHSEDFSTYAARRMARDLPDLLEAAAAYLADIEGHTRFSRPMLMDKLDEIGIADVREDMLRACDGLLDRGKLRKCSDGRYTTTDNTGFRAGPRAGPGPRA